MFVSSFCLSFCSFPRAREREKNKNIGFHKKLGFRKKRETTLRHFVFSSLFWGGIFDDEEKNIRSQRRRRIKREREKSYCFCCRALIARGVFERERRKRESLREFFL